jgi:DNA-binding response OmpR family regulator
MAPATVDTLTNVLLVEDDPDTRDVMSRLLEKAGFAVRGTPLVGEALLLMEYHMPSHILLDLSLPDAGGVVLLRSVRRQNLPVKIAVVTASGPDSPAVADATRWRPDAVFHKPIDFPKIRKWLEEQ